MNFFDNIMKDMKKVYNFTKWHNQEYFQEGYSNVSSSFSPSIYNDQNIQDILNTFIETLKCEMSDKASSISESKSYKPEEFISEKDMEL